VRIKWIKWRILKEEILKYENEWELIRQGKKIVKILKKLIFICMHLWLYKLNQINVYSGALGFYWSKIIFKLIFQPFFIIYSQLYSFIKLLINSAIFSKLTVPTRCSMWNSESHVVFGNSKLKANAPAVMTLRPSAYMNLAMRLTEAGKCQEEKK
jgi:hypothetical protein